MERGSFETLGDMEVTGGRIGWLAAGPVEALVRTGGAQGVQSRMRQMFLWVLVLECLCSMGIWPGAIMYDSVFNRCVAAIFVMIVIALVRVIWRCTKIIQELERQK